MAQGTDHIRGKYYKIKHMVAPYFKNIYVSGIYNLRLKQI